MFFELLLGKGKKMSDVDNDDVLRVLERLDRVDRGKVWWLKSEEEEEIKRQLKEKGLGAWNIDQAISEVNGELFRRYQEGDQKGSEQLLLPLKFK